MPPKKGQKMALTDFLADSSLGSWADEMEELPSAPAPRAEGNLGRGRGDRDFGRGDRGGDFTRPDRGFPQRDELPLPTAPPYIAFIGNLAYDLTESELGSFFGDCKTKSVKIIRDRDEKPKGFGYVEFDELEGLKKALDLSGTNMSGRSIRVSVADPPKEGHRSFGDRGAGGGFDDDRFAGSWRRDGPLPDRSPPRRSRFDSDRPPREPRESSGAAEGNDDWRSNRTAREMPPPDLPPPRRRSGFSTPEQGAGPGPADGDVWAIGSKFKPSAPLERSKFGSVGGERPDRPDRERVPPAQPDEPSDWRSNMRRTTSSTGTGRFDSSPSTSNPPTPIMARKKLELTPRSAAPSGPSTPLGSPKSATAPPSSRPNPFGAAKIVDTAAREAEVAERLNREREARAQLREREREDSGSFGSRRERGDGDGPFGPRRTSGPPVRTGSGSRPPSDGTQTPPVAASPRIPSATVRPAFSFANAAGASKKVEEDPAEALAEQVAEVSV